MSLITISELYNIDWQTPDAVPALLQDDIQVWRIRVPETIAEIESDDNELSIAERDRASRFVQSEDALRYMVAHTALRQLLSPLTGIAPHQLSFTKNEFGKPALAFQHNKANIHFNLSHSGRYVVVGLSKHPVGVDVEIVKSDFNFRSLLPHYFTVAEANFITNASLNVNAFFTAWTRKEALGKGLGTGITENMQNLPCIDGLHHSTRLIVANDWKIYTFGVDDGHVASVAMSGAAGAIRFFDYQI